MAAIIGILTVLATVTADSSATNNHAIGLRSGAIDYAPKIATSMRAVDPAQFSWYRCWYRCFNEVKDYPKPLAQTTGAAANGPETDPGADSGVIDDPYHDYNDAAVSLTVQSSTACTAGAPATRASSRTTSCTRHQFSTGRGLSNEPKYPDHDHYCDGNDEDGCETGGYLLHRSVAVAPTYSLDWTANPGDTFGILAISRSGPLAFETQNPYLLDVRGAPASWAPPSQESSVTSCRKATLAFGAFVFLESGS